MSIIAQEKEFHQWLEDLFIRSSSEITDEVESFVAETHKMKVERINELVQQVIDVDQEDQYSPEHIEKEVTLLDLLSEYVQSYWNLIGTENRKSFYRVAFLLFKIVKDVQCEGILSGDLFRLYERAVYRYTNSVCQIVKTENPDWHLFEFTVEVSPDGGDTSGNSSTVVFYPDTAEDKAVVRKHDINNENAWIELPKSKEKITAEKIRQHMKKRGYT